MLETKLSLKEKSSILYKFLNMPLASKRLIFIKGKFAYSSSFEMNNYASDSFIIKKGTNVQSYIYPILDPIKSRIQNLALDYRSNSDWLQNQKWFGLVEEWKTCSILDQHYSVGAVNIIRSFSCQSHHLSKSNSQKVNIPPLFNLFPIKRRLLDCNLWIFTLNKYTPFLRSTRNSIQCKQTGP